MKASFNSTATMPTIIDILAARKAVYAHLNPTPLFTYAGINKLVGTSTWLKHENHQPVGAFKVRGGLYLASQLSDTEKIAGLYSASTGNHGQSIAYAASKNHIAATIVVPEVANPGKVAAMRGLGATVEHHGKDFDEAREWAQHLANQAGGKFIGPTDEQLICGVGTYGLEIMQTLPDVDCIIVPVGAGSGVCGTAIVAKTLNPNIQIIAVQSAQAPSMQLSWAAKKPVPAATTTLAEGLATRIPFENTQKIMRKYVDDFILVDDEDINHAIYLLLQHTHNLVEEAGAASLAAAIKIRQQLQGKKVALVISGGNLDSKNLFNILNSYEKKNETD